MHLGLNLPHNSKASASWPDRTQTEETKNPQNRGKKMKKFRTKNPNQ